jgi:hypothetical protein
MTLIDFDTPTPPPQRPIYLDHDDDDGHTYRSQPFREVHPSDLEPDNDHSPPPLPVPPRSYHHDDQTSY